MEIKPTYLDAVTILAPNVNFRHTAGTSIVEWDISNSGVTQPTDAEINTKLASMISDWDAQEYARQRQVEYPSIEECVHAILDDTLDVLQAKRAEIKLKYPKGG